MELYLIVALFFVYLISAAMGSEILVKRIWTMAFIAAFLVTASALLLLRFTHQDVMMQADTFNWYYAVYICGSLALVLGLVNLWMYRRALWHLFYPETEDTKE